MATTSVTLNDIIDNLETSVANGEISPASRIAMNYADLISLLVAIRNELDKKQDVAADK